MGRKKREINTESGKRLKQWLKEQNITAKRLSERINYTPQYLSDIITGKASLTPDLARIIKNAFPEIPLDERVRTEWLLCEDDFETEGDRIDAITSGTRDVYKLITELMNLHGYEIVTDTFDYEPPGVDENGREYRSLHYGIKSTKNNACAYIGHDKIDSLIDEIDDFIEYKCSSAVSVHNRTARRNSVARIRKEVDKDG